MPGLELAASESLPAKFLDSSISNQQAGRLIPGRSCATGAAWLWRGRHMNYHPAQDAGQRLDIDALCAVMCVADPDYRACRAARALLYRATGGVVQPRHGGLPLK